MAVAFVNTGSASPGSVSSFSITHSPTNGNCVVVVVVLADTTKSVSSVQDNGSGGGSTYYFRNAVSQAGSCRTEIWSTTSTGIVGSPTSITVNLSGASQVNAISGQYSGVAQISGTTSVAHAAETHLGFSNASKPLVTFVSNGWIVVGAGALGTSTITASNGNLRTTSVGSTVEAAFIDSGAFIIDSAETCNALITSSPVAAVSLELTPVVTGTPGGRLVQGGCAGRALNTDVFTTGVCFELPNTAGNLIVVAVGCGGGTNTATVSDTQGNSYKTAIGPVTDNHSGGNSYIFYAENCDAGTNTVIVTAADAAHGLGVAIHEYSGAAPGNSLDQVSSGIGTSGNLDSGSAVITQPAELVFGFGNITINGTMSAVGSAVIRVAPSPNSIGFSTEDYIATALGSYNVAMSSSTSGNWVMLMAAFRDVGFDTAVLTGQWKIS